MSKTEALIGAVQRFWHTPRIIKLAFVLINSAYILFLIGFTTNDWVSQTGQSSSYRQGLFNHCVVSGIFTCCQSLNSHLRDNNVDVVPVWISITRVILGVCLIPSTIAVVTMYICLIVNVVTEESRMKLYLQRACYIASYISVNGSQYTARSRLPRTMWYIWTGACLLAGIVVYGENFGRDNWQSGAAVHFSYALTTMSGIMFVMAGITISAPSSPFTVCKQQDEPDERDERDEPAYRQRPIAMIPPSPLAPSAPPSRPADENLCCICLTDPVNSAFANCGHASCCIYCANTLLTSSMTCPICRKFITSVVRIYRT